MCLIDVPVVEREMACSEGSFHSDFASDLDVIDHSEEINWMGELTWVTKNNLSNR